MSDQPDITPADPDTGATPTPVRKDLMSDSTISIAEYNRVKDESIRRKELIKKLKAENEQLTQQVAALDAENEELVSNMEQLTEQVDAERTEIQEQLTEITAERDEWKQKYESAPSEHLAELNQYREKERLAERDTMLSRVAESLQIDPAKLGDVKLLAKLSDDAELPDEETLKSALSEVVKTRDWLKVQPKTKAADVAAKGAESVADAQSGTTDPVGSKSSPDGEMSRMGILLSSKGSGPGLVRGQQETPQVRPSVETAVNSAFAKTGRSLDNPFKL